MVQEALKEHEEDRLSRVIDDRRGKVVLTLFEEAQQRAKDNRNTPIFEVMEPATVKAFIAREAEEVFDDKM